MIHTFVNRRVELSLLNKIHSRGGLIVMTGRRRVGKSRLLRHWLGSVSGIYSQAIEGSSVVQFDQVRGDILSAPGIQTNIVPKTWEELFELIDRESRQLTICIDEFPYLVASDPTLPSRFQRWLDLSKKNNLTLVLAGSSRRLMHDSFLDANAPLYGRAQRIINLEPMSYKEFCQALKLSSDEEESFTKYALVGGIPKYWELVDPKLSAVKIAEDLYFDFAPYMQGEPRRVLKDEKLDDMYPHSVLEVIGRGAHRPSEIAARLNTKQQNLSRVLQLLSEANLITREIPFGVNIKAAKHVLYRLTDPAMRFWYTVQSPHASRWLGYTQREKQKLLRDHASQVFEDYCRQLYPNSHRFWDKEHEFDLIAPDPGADDRVIVAEVKFKLLKPQEKEGLLVSLKARWEGAAVGRAHPKAIFKVLGVAEVLG